MIKFFVTFLFSVFSMAATYEVQLSQSQKLKPNDHVKLKGSSFEVVYKGVVEPVPCAIPGQNCGAAYRPPRPEFDVTCTGADCAYVYVEGSGNTLPDVSITVENEETCAKDTTQSCIRKFGQNFKSGQECTTLKTALGKFHCLGRFPKDAPKETKNLCEEIPKDLRLNCLAEYATRYNEASFCAKFSKDESAYKDRCYYFLSLDKKDSKLCKKITKDTDYYKRCMAKKR